MSLLSFCGGMIALVFAICIILFSEWLKLLMDWDGSYIGVSWFKIWRIERLRKQDKFREANILQYGTEWVEAEEREWERRNRR